MDRFSSYLADMGRAPRVQRAYSIACRLLGNYRDAYPGLSQAEILQHITGDLGMRHVGHPETLVERLYSRRDLDDIGKRASRLPRKRGANAKRVPELQMELFSNYLLK